jgi:hypothetical protein
MAFQNIRNTPQFPLLKNSIFNHKIVQYSKVPLCHMSLHYKISPLLIKGFLTIPNAQQGCGDLGDLTRTNVKQNKQGITNMWALPIYIFTHTHTHTHMLYVHILGTMGEDKDHVVGGKNIWE